ncbi:MAG: UDP-3-O-acyl-N-acetylglucosamine deacetylase [Planctomycetota bacterium]|jgi:UDP-3-O-acyl N-acetylglucosamine deacetylase
MKQTTLANPASLTGVSLHEGHEVTLTLKPAPADSGYRFIRTDRNNAEVCANVANITELQRRTMLVQDGVEVHTCEHVLAALYGLGIDNACIEISAPEPPAGDGSAQAFVELIDEAGIETLDADAKQVAITSDIQQNANGSTFGVASSDHFSIDYTLDYGVPFMPPSQIQFDITPDVFRNEIAPARTFCLEEEAKHLQAMGFGKGADTQNTLVVSADGPLENTLRFDDEYARHKLLDIIGDLALVGARLQASVVAVKSGHRLNQLAAIEISKQTEASA